LAQVVLVCPVEDAAAFREVVPEGVTVYPAQVTPVRWHADGTVAAWDVLAAFASVASDLPDDALVARITADCPALDPEAVTLTLAAARVTGFAVSEHTASGWPDGSACEVVTVGLLREAARAATWPRDREHPTRWLYRHHPAIVVENPHGDVGHLKLSVDCEADLTRVREYLQARTRVRQHVGTLTPKDS
jgi:spore coat polysaccharide biosynthesis protein SpsF (cytidylyltransferase family)